MFTVKQSPNYRKGRGNHLPRAFVIHTGGGSFESNLNTMLNKKSERSYHYLFGNRGKVIQLVDTKDTAWHAGVVKSPTWKNYVSRSNPNDYTIGLSLGGRLSDKENLIDILMMAIVISMEAKKWNIPIDRDHVIGHYEINIEKPVLEPDIDLNALVYLARLLS